MRIDIDKAWRQIQSLVNDIITLLPNLVLAVVIFALFYAVGKYISNFVRSLIERAGRGRGVGVLLGRLAHYIVLVIGLLVGLSVMFPSFRAGDLIQVLGIGGVAIGFAFKDIFQNFLAGVIILITRPFRIGDQIIVKGYEGTVEDIQTRATIIRTYDNRQVVIPNSTVFTEEVTVISAFDKRRSEYEIGIDYGDDIGIAKSTILSALAELEEVEKEPSPDVLTVGLGESAVVLRVRWWNSPRKTNILVVKDRVLSRLKTALNEAGVDLPYPVRTVLLHDQTGTLPDDRKSDAQESSGEGQEK